MLRISNLFNRQILYVEKLRVVFNQKSHKMAQDSEGRKFNRIPGYTKKVGGKTIKVKPHIRSNRSDSKGKK